MKKKTNTITVKGAEYIVGIGASAGGLEALQEFFKAAPNNTGLGFVVIQHLSPDYKSLMDELLARYTKLKIRKAEDGMLVEPNTIYLIPPRNNLTIFHGKLMLEDQGKRSGIILPIDIFFRSLAKDFGNKAIGVILSGTGSDGTLGTRAIKEAGGMVMVQDERTAKFDGMPRSSISTGLVDYVLPPRDMPEALLNYLKHPFIDRAGNKELMIAGEEDNLTKVMMILRDFCGIDFSYYKENTIVRRIERRLSINRFERLEDYLKLLSASEKEKDILYRELLIGVTRFFRDEAAFDVIKNDVLPRIIEAGQKHLRIWSVACSTGEEVYSLAMIIKDYLDENNLNIEVKIFATDIDKHSLELAGQAFYPESIVSDVDQTLLAKYFVKRENGYQVSESLRKMAIFATHNVLNDPPFSKLDLIVCRNLFIYFKPDSQSRVLNIFQMALKPGGFLFMGSSESLGVYTESFSVVSSKHKIYTKKAGFKAGLQNEITTGFSVRRNFDYDDYKNGTTNMRKKENFSDLIVDAILPPSLLLDENLNIIQVINDINPYVQLRSGKFSQNLNSFISKELSIVVTSIFRRLKGKQEKVVFEGVNIKNNERTFKADIKGSLIRRSDDTLLLLVSFIESKSEPAKSEVKELIKIEDQYKDQLIDLQNELQFTKENLQATVEELETSNEELQASNEELIASNEELQSTNEELQSVNEELYTVNSEYQNKIEELTQLNNDVNNLLKNTEIAALYLDRKMCIRKFTPGFAKVSKILDSDIGRPIAQLATASVYPDFMKDVQKVQETLQIIEKEVLDQNGLLYLLRIVPYRTDYQAVDGILVTMVNISMIQKERDYLKTANNRLHQALEMGNMAWWEWDVSTNQVEMHERKATMLGYTLNEFPKDVYEICKLIHPEDYGATMQSMKDHLQGKTKLYDAIYRIKTKTGSFKWYYDKGGIVQQTEEGKPAKVVGLVVDITKLKTLEEDLQHEREGH
jgi:two-component system, chemotaxis family, CheB/CheR fusion protein